MTKFPAVVVLLLASLSACGNDDEPSAAGVDPCYRDQAREYRDAAILLRESIQTHVPKMIRAAGDLFEAGVDRDVSQGEAALEEFNRAADDFQADGDDFAGQMDDADAACE